MFGNYNKTPTIKRFRKTQTEAFHGHNEPLNVNY
jgi:hypothetical protein